MAKHIHSEVIKAWADGAAIQVANLSGDWQDVFDPIWKDVLNYRVKPTEYKISDGTVTKDDTFYWIGAAGCVKEVVTPDNFQQHAGNICQFPQAYTVYKPISDRLSGDVLQNLWIANSRMTLLDIQEAIIENYKKAHKHG